MNIPRLCLKAAACITSLFLAGAASAYSGAIYTSTATGTTVNANNFHNCEDVYLNGGPQNMNAAGLPDGLYFFQVTDPSGATLLSTTPALERRVLVANGVVSGRAPDLDPAGYTSELFHKDGTLDSSNGSTPVQLWHFNETPNAGGVYKVWMIPVGAAQIEEGGIVLTFDNSDAKTDNFRCVHDDDDGGGGGEAVISGRKFHDINANGVYDVGEEWTDAGGYPPVTIQVTYWFTDKLIDGITFTAVTSSLGFWSASVPSGAQFSVSEDIPGCYLQSGPVDGATVVSPGAGTSNATASAGVWNGFLSSADLVGIDFGNLCIGGGTGAKTLGFWSNKNGEKVFGSLSNPTALVSLSALNLRNANGTAFDPSTYAQFRTWILGASATNMANMLSAQLAAMHLNVRSGGVSGSDIVYAPGCGDFGLNNAFITIASLMAKADQSLCLYGSTTAGHPQRMYQECLKNALDAANNNLNFVQSGPCNCN